jgi:hypothetical protein
MGLWEALSTVTMPYEERDRTYDEKAMLRSSEREVGMRETSEKAIVKSSFDGETVDRGTNVRLATLRVCILTISISQHWTVNI